MSSGTGMYNILIKRHIFVLAKSRFTYVVLQNLLNIWFAIYCVNLSLNIIVFYATSYLYYKETSKSKI